MCGAHSCTITLTQACTFSRDTHVRACACSHILLLPHTHHPPRLQRLGPSSAAGGSWENTCIFQLLGSSCQKGREEETEAVGWAGMGSEGQSRGGPGCLSMEGSVFPWKHAAGLLLSTPLPHWSFPDVPGTKAGVGRMRCQGYLDTDTG